MNAMTPYRQLRIDACNLITFLKMNRTISAQDRRTCIAGLQVYVDTCTPDESVAGFEDMIESVKRIIELEMGE